MGLQPTDIAHVTTSLQASDITAIASVVVAVCALFATLWQARKSHLHSLISVQPVLDIHIAYKDLPNNQFELLVILSNVGLGPAKITSWKYYLDDTEINYDRSIQLNHTGQLFTKAFDSSVKATLSMGKIKGSIIKLNYKETLLRLTTSADNQNYLIRRFEDIRVVIEYTDLYGNRQPFFDSKEIEKQIT